MRFLPFLLLLSSCAVLPESYLDDSELMNTPTSKVIYEGNTVWLVRQFENGTKFQDHGGVHKYKYTYKKIGTEFQIVELSFYDWTSVLLDTSSATGYATSIMDYKKNGDLIFTKTLDRHGKLIQPKHIPYARMVRKYNKDGSWTSKYYDGQNKPRCGYTGFKVTSAWDTIHLQQADTSTYMLRILDTDKIDCQGNTLK